MIKEYSSLFERAAVFLDVVLMAVAFLLAYHLRNTPEAGLFPIWVYVPILFFGVIFMVAAIRSAGLYLSRRLRSPIGIVFRLGGAVGAAAVFTASVLYFLKFRDLSRLLFGYFFLISFVLLALEHLAVKTGLEVLRKKGFNYRNLIVVGNGNLAARVVEQFAKHSEWGYRILGVVVSEGGEDLISALAGFDNLGKVKELESILDKYPVDEVLFSDEGLTAEELESLVRMVELRGPTPRIAIDPAMSQVGRPRTDLIGDIPLLSFITVPLAPVDLIIKRGIDILGGIFGCLILLLVWPFVALAIVIESPGPVFFRQNRVGRNGRRFSLLKFRTMIPEADLLKSGLMRDNEMNGAIFKIREDPRITKVGRFLRRLSLDEFPQFWNVLKGDMSLVGTRPPTPDEVEKYEPWQRRRLSLKPGITGLWQVSGRNEIRDFDQVVALDLNYIDNWSLGLDFKILVKTIPEVLFGHGS